MVGEDPLLREAVFSAAAALQLHPRAVDVVHQMTTSMHDAHLIDSLLGIVEHDARDALRATRTPSLVTISAVAR